MSNSGAPLPQFKILTPHRPLVFHAEGILYGTANPGSVLSTPRTHCLRIKRIRYQADLSKNLPIGRAASQALISAERRPEERERWKRFLAWNPEEDRRLFGLLTHTLTWGYWLSDGTFTPILRASFNFSVEGYSTNGVAEICGEFLAEQALSLDAATDGRDRLIQHVALTSIRTENRIYWLVLLFTRYLWLVRGDFIRPL